VYYLVGDSHAAQITFALKQVASRRGVNFYFINTESNEDFPRSFWTQEVKNDRILSHLLNVMNDDDFLLIAFHRGRLNPDRDSHYSAEFLRYKDQRAELFTSNMMTYLPQFDGRNINVVLVKDGPLLSDTDTMIEACMYEYLRINKNSCEISFQRDDDTRFLQSQSFEYLAEKFRFVTTVDYLPELYDNGFFSPISENGEYLMFDRHHLTERASLQLVHFFQGSLIGSAENE
jgi:hypothetical protein